MEARIFVDHARMPETPKLKVALENSYALFYELETFCESCTTDWVYQNKRYGWIFRMLYRKKVLFWITPFKGSFELRFIVKPEEKPALEELDIGEAVRKDLRLCRGHAEGYTLEFRISDRTLFDDMKKMLERMLILRN